MPVTFQILEEGHIVSYGFVEPWTLDELLVVFEQIRTHLNSVEHKVHLMVDLQQLKNTSINALRVRKYDPWFDSPNAEYAVIIGAKPFMRAVGETILRLTHFERAKFVETEADALIYLRTRITQANSSKS